MLTISPSRVSLSPFGRVGASMSRLLMYWLLVSAAIVTRSLRSNAL